MAGALLRTMLAAKRKLGGADGQTIAGMETVVGDPARRARAAGPDARETHVAAHEGSVAGRNAAGKRARIAERVSPWVTFVDPETAHVGLTESEARRRYRSVRAVTYSMAGVDRAQIVGRTDGLVKLVAARRPLLGWLGGGLLVGAQVVGPRGGELIHECALAIHTRMFAGRLAQMIHAYPTMSVAVQQAASQLFPLGRALVEDPPESSD